MIACMYCMLKSCMFSILYSRLSTCTSLHVHAWYKFSITSKHSSYVVNTKLVKWCGIRMFVHTPTENAKLQAIMVGSQLLKFYFAFLEFLNVITIVMNDEPHDILYSWLSLPDVMGNKESNWRDCMQPYEQATCSRLCHVVKY